MSSVYETILNHVKKYVEEENCRSTEQRYNVYDNGRKGYIVLRWRKKHKMVVIRDVQLDSSEKDKNDYILTKTCDVLLNLQNEMITTIRLEGVTNEKIFEKLSQRGWYSSSDSNLDFQRV